ncbi:hypothetical protein LINPERHAP1_LOCUS11887 [Linum perenne]
MKMSQSTYVLLFMILLVVANNHLTGVGAKRRERFCYKTDIYTNGNPHDFLRCNQECVDRLFNYHALGHIDAQPPHSCSCYLPC